MMAQLEAALEKVRTPGAAHISAAVFRNSQGVICMEEYSGFHTGMTTHVTANTLEELIAMLNADPKGAQIDAKRKEAANLRAQADELEDEAAAMEKQEAK